MSNGTTGAFGTSGSSLGAAGGTSTAGLADWAAPYITGYLGQAQALGQMPYQAYQGPLTAGASDLQTKAFQGVGALTVPESISQAATTAGQAATTAGGMSYTPTAFTSGFNAPTPYAGGQFTNQFTAPSAFQAGQFTNQFTAPSTYQAVGSSFADAGVAGQYMNPYLQQALQPQLQELQRQADINRMQQASRFAQVGALGGSRQGMVEAENQRNLLSQIARTTGEQYASAYDRAAQQFNAEQARKIQEAQFGAQQGMTGAELAARYGLEAARAAEQSRQFAAQQGMTGAELGARYGLEAQRAAEQSRQFGAQQGMTAAELGARYGLDAQRMAEQSRQFGAGFGLDALSKQMQAAELQGRLGTLQSEAQRANLAQQLAAGATQRDIEAQGIAADLAEFNAQREFPYKQVQFMRDMISGLPIGSVTNTPAQLSGIAQLIGAVGGIDKLLKDTGQSSLSDLLGNLGFKLGG